MYESVEGHPDESEPPKVYWALPAITLAKIIYYQ
jgi:hypothetical protein